MIKDWIYFLTNLLEYHFQYLQGNVTSQMVASHPTIHSSHSVWHSARKVEKDLLLLPVT